MRLAAFPEPPVGRGEEVRVELGKSVVAFDNNNLAECKHYANSGTASLFLLNG